MDRQLTFLITAVIVVVLLPWSAFGDRADARGSRPGLTSGAESEMGALVTPSPSTSGSPSVTSEPSPEPTAARLDREPAYAKLDMWDAQFLSLGGLTTGLDGKIYVADSERDRVVIVNPDGTDARTLSFAGIEPRTGSRNDVAVDDDGFVYVLITSGRPGVVKLSPAGRIVATWGEGIGEQPGQFVDPKAIAVDDGGFVYVAENLFNYAARVQKFTGDGEFVAEWTQAGDKPFPYGPLDIAAGDESIYVLSTGYGPDAGVSIFQFDRDGALVATLAGFSRLKGSPGIIPMAFDVAPDGSLLVADPFVRQIVKLSPAGDVLTRWTVIGPPGRPGHAIEIAVDDAGRVYVADSAGKMIHAYEPAN